jgi:hypothetical protein
LQPALFFHTFTLPNKITMKIVYSALLLFFSSISAKSQILLHLQPNAADGKDAAITSWDHSGNYGIHPEYGSIAWTCSGSPCNQRCLVEFDLSSIPPSSTIVSAFLGLYANPSPVNAGGVAMQGANESVIQRITQSWGEMTVTWDNQPPTSSVNEVIIPPTSDPAYHANLDVAAMVQDMVNNPGSSHGFLIKHTTETYYKSMIFASSDYSNPNIHPELTIEYIPSNCMTLRLSDVNDKDASITSWDANGNYGIHPEYGGIAWTCSGNPCNQRCLMEFDMSAIPAGTAISSATLSLFANPSPVNANGIAMQGANESVLQRITDPWNEMTVTWNNAPATTTQNQVIIPVSADQSYNAVLDVTYMVQDMINSPSSSHGFLIKLITETYYKSMIFASSDYADTSVHPVLQICYSTVDVGHLNSDNSIHVYPNPASQSVFVHTRGIKNKIGPVEWKLFSTVGVLERTEKISSSDQQLDISDLAPGIYFYSFTEKGSCIANGKLMVY